MASGSLNQARDGDLALAYRRLSAAYDQSLRYARELRGVYVRLQRSVWQSLLGLANALEAKDAYTRGHSERVGRLSHRLAVKLTLPREDIEVVAQAGLLHDLGKIGVPETILGKRGPLDPSERHLMERHPEIGAQIVAPLESLAPGVLVIRHHHERWDGTGYPDRLRAGAIPIGARIVAVADVYDALTSDRPYRPAFARDAALKILRDEAGRTLDPEMVEAFVAFDDPIDVTA